MSNFDSGIVNGRKTIVGAAPARTFGIQVIAPGSPRVKVARITFEAKVIDNNFLSECVTLVTVIKSQGQTLTTVGLDLRDDVLSAMASSTLL